MFAPSNNWDATPECETLACSLFAEPQQRTAMHQSPRKSRHSVMTSVRRTGRRRRKLDSGPLRVPPEIPPVTSCSANSVSRTGGQQNFKEKKRAHRKEKRADLGRGFGVPREPLAPDADLLTSWPEVSNDERKCSKVSLRLDSSVEFLDQTTGNASSPPVLNERKKGDTRENYLERAEKRLKGSRFRMLNEKLYTSTADEAMDMFSEDPVAYVEYHDGYRESQNLWPEKPVDGLIQWLKKRPESWIVADFGCGEAVIAASVPQKVHSFDFHALNERVVVANMAEVPLDNDCVDVVIFCLSLMGINVVDFLVEAHRVLRAGGLMKIAEVGSRFDNIKQFVHKVERLGFQLIGKKSGQKNYFIMFEFKKKDLKLAKAILPEIKLKPCIYKKR